jgi:hypothetical protein
MTAQESPIEAIFSARLAMRQYQAGETARASDYCDWDTRWKGTQQGLPPAHTQDLKRFRAEAQQEFGLDSARRTEQHRVVVMWRATRAADWHTSRCREWVVGARAGASRSYREASLRS